jgi:hypothetical protein
VRCSKRSVPIKAKNSLDFLCVRAERIAVQSFPVRLGGNGTSDCCGQQQVLHQTVVSVRKEGKTAKEVCAREPCASSKFALTHATLSKVRGVRHTPLVALSLFITGSVQVIAQSRTTIVGQWNNAALQGVFYPPDSRIAIWIGLSGRFSVSSSRAA